MYTCFTIISCEPGHTRTRVVFYSIYARSTILASGIYAIVDICNK